MKRGIPVNLLCQDILSWLKKYTLCFSEIKLEKEIVKLLTPSSLCWSEKRCQLNAHGSQSSLYTLNSTFPSRCCSNDSEKIDEHLTLLLASKRTAWQFTATDTSCSVSSISLFSTNEYAKCIGGWTGEESQK